jgi:hypothetical protein
MNAWGESAAQKENGAFSIVQKTPLLMRDEAEFT